MVRQRVGMDRNVRMGIQKVDQNLGVDALGQHPHFQRAQALEHFEGGIGVQERSLDVVHVPEHRVVPVDAADRFAFREKHLLIAADHHTGDDRSRARQVFRVTVNDEIGPFHRVLSLQGPAQERGADGGIQQDA